ncbi:MAG: prepilin-type N-terminal cleavage/methylation domain-containing protein [Candidatus Omnitrophica bacterium]|nr:prepilin-type N-terminal cleavage/methylation domain-containing protein [Candidatus Omnitrophota bacterium]
MRPDLNPDVKILRRGVTLVELVMAIAILAAIAIPMGLMIAEQVRGMMTASDLAAAGNLARYEMEKLNNLPFESIASGSSVYPGYVYDVSRTVTTTEGAAGAALKDITVTVNRPGEATPLTTLYSSIADNVTYSS